MVRLGCRFVKERYCTVRRAVAVVLILLAFCLLLSCVQAYLWTFDEHYRMCNHRQAVRESDFPRLWTWVTELTVFGVAPFAALVFNLLVMREIRSITTRGPAVLGPVGGGGGGGGQNQASTITLLTVSFYLICTWLPATVVYSLEREFPIQTEVPGEGDAVLRRHLTYYTVRKCVEEVTLSNSACYFFIYYLTGKHFRVRFKEMMLPRRCRERDPDLDHSANGTLNGRSLHAKQYVAVPSCKTSDNGHNTCVTNV